MLELIAAIVVLGILSWLTIPRMMGNSSESRKNACYVNKGDIDVQVELWYRNKGTWPDADLSDILADPNYFPDGLPTCPVDGMPYTLDGDHRVDGHDHP